MKLKVICLNLWEGGNLFDAILDFLAKENADILMLQEVYDGKDRSFPKNYRSIEILQERLGYQFYDFAPAMIDLMPEGKVLGGNAVFSKFPLSSHEPIFFNEPFGERHPDNPKEFPTTPRNLQQVTVTLPENELNIFNFQGVWDLDGDNYSPQRKQMSDIIIKAIRGKSNVILGGDTNARPTNKAMRAIEQHLHSVFGDELVTTFNMKHKSDPGYASSVVDMLFVSQNITVLSHKCPNIDLSDHLPLVATFKV
jgi:endonuclease/exonuclease/phosphatase family metal-dependent hydrolase